VNDLLLEVTCIFHSNRTLISVCKRRGAHRSNSMGLLTSTLKTDIL